jgi:transcriptional regulator with XRE-family HTH domain
MAFIQSDKFEGSALECARFAGGLSLDDLMDMTGINSVRLAGIESGRNYPTNEEIKLLADATQVLPNFFYRAWIKPPEHSYNIKFRKPER